MLCFAIVRNLVGSLLQPSSCQHQNIFSRISNFQEAKTEKKLCAACFSALALFLLLLIPEHEMRRLVLMANDVNSFTVRHHQYQTINLEKIGISKRVIPVFVKTETQEFASEPMLHKLKTALRLQQQKRKNQNHNSHSPIVTPLVTPSSWRGRGQA